MDIYEPREDSYLLQPLVEKYAYGRVLDMGTGSGIQAETAAKSPMVKEVVAIDINENAISLLKEKRMPKITPIHADLFSSVTAKFNTIICNPPYLPQDKGIEDPALYGGIKGWEFSARFFNEVSQYLAADGVILFLFSSVTNKEKIEELIANHLYEFEEIGSLKLAFEELFVYKIAKSTLLRTLESKGVTGINYLTKGKRGLVYQGVYDQHTFVKSHIPSKNQVCVVVKVERPDSGAIARMENETRWLQMLNKKGIGPRYYFSGDGFVVMGFAKGVPILEYVKNAELKKVVRVIVSLLEQCYTLDTMNVNKEEMHHPHKHVLVDDNSVVMLDFERCRRVDEPQNVTQCVEFVSRMKQELSWIDADSLRELAKAYKSTYARKDFENILHLIKNKSD